MSEFNINDLPSELLADIFQFLDVVSLKEATLSCKLWNNVIESTCRWPLEYANNAGKLCGYNEEQRMNFIMTTNRKFGKVKIQSYPRHRLKLKHHGPLVDFILSQDTLKSLAISTDETSPSILAELGKLNVSFRLTQLTITGDTHHGDNFLKFVKSQANSLVELKIGWNILRFVYECIIESMPKLITLSLLGSSGLPDVGIDFYERFETNDSVQTIKLETSGNHDRDSQFVGKFLKKFPNVHSLVLGHPEPALLIAESFEKLESLTIGFYFFQYSFDCVTFPNLKTLHIRYLCVKIDWNKFTKAHSRLTELVIERMDKKSHLTSNDIDQITTNVDLQHIRLGIGFVADDRFIEIIRTKCTNLKVLDLHMSCLPRGLEDNVGINTLRLCHDTMFRCHKNPQKINWLSCPELP